MVDKAKAEGKELGMPDDRKPMSEEMHQKVSKIHDQNLYRWNIDNNEVRPSDARGMRYKYKTYEEQKEEMMKNFFRG